jgi:RNA polymerase sigma-70 factor (ECF subfamily)
VFNETELVRLAQEGDRYAFVQLHEHYYTSILQYLTGIVRDVEIAKELTQETFLQVWQSLSKLHENSNFRAWLYRIAGNNALTYLRKLKRASMIPPKKKISLEAYTVSGDKEELGVPGPEEIVEQREALELAEIALDLIRPVYRDCLILYQRKGLSVQEIAKKLNKGENTVKSYLSNAKKALRQIYKELQSGQRCVPPRRMEGKTNE